jgi:hypothetical protein
VILDYGWEAQGIGVLLSLNTPELIVRHLTPPDLVQWGMGDTQPSAFANNLLSEPACPGNNLAGSSGHVCQGELDAGIHIEANGWRTPGYSGNPQYESGLNNRPFKLPIPPDWNQQQVQKSGSIP